MSEQSHFSRQRKTVRLFIVGSFLALGVLIIRGVQFPGKTSQQPIRTLAPVVMRPVTQPGKRIDRTARRPEKDDELERLISVSRPETARAVSPATAEIFPSLTEVLVDWRQFRPDRLTVSPLPNSPLTFTRLTVKDEGRFVTWIGRNPELPGASFVGVATINGYDAILVIPGSNQFSFHVRGKTVVMTESSPGEERCGMEPSRAVKPSIGDGGSVAQISYVSGFDPNAGLLAATAALKVDVLFAYNSATLAAAAAKSTDAVGYIDAQCKAKIETANVALSQSGVTAFVWRYLGLVAAPSYTRTGDLLDDLTAMAPGGALASWVSTIRYQQGADQVMLLVESSTAFAGEGYTPVQTAVTRDYAVATMIWNSSALLMAHELAHNFGCQHDRAHVNVLAVGSYGDPIPDNNGFWCYGQLWQNPPLPRGYTGSSGTGGTVMSYADWPIPYFSNPNITVHLTGSLLGWNVNPDLGTQQQIGQPETAPAAAYNARVLSDQAQAMSAINEEVVLPLISAQPAGVSVDKGLSFTLSVTATGGGLSYQWLKNGVAITGAQASSYSKTAGDAEPDGYSVTVSNLKGSVTSSVVMVTVTTPSPVGASVNSGGGSGGGSLGGSFFSAFFLLSFVRWFFSRTSVNTATEA